MDNNRRCLVTAIGSMSAYCAISSLRAGGIYVVGTDIYPGCWHAETALCDAFYQSPLAKDEEQYIEFLCTVIDRECIGLLIPITDVEIDVINRHRSRIAALGTVICTQQAETLAVCRDKYALYRRFVDDETVNVPRTLLAESTTEEQGAALLPLIAKPVDGRSSEGLQRAYTREQLEPLLRENGYILQETIEGDVCTVDYVRDCYGADFSVPRRELLRTKNGAGVTVEIFHNSVLESIVSHIGRELGVVGCVNMEFIDRQGVFWLIDINPRFSAGIAFSQMAGYDMATSHLRCCLGERILPAVCFGRQIITKRYTEEMTWIEDKLNITSVNKCKNGGVNP